MIELILEVAGPFSIIGAATRLTYISGMLETSDIIQFFVMKNEALFHS